MSVVPPRVAPYDPSLIERASATPNDGERVLLALYVRDKCTASASAVLVDRNGRYLGAIAPGSAALLRVPASGQVLAFSSIDVTAHDHAEPLVQEVDLPPAPDGLVFRSLRGSRTGRCATGQYMEAIPATKIELEEELAEKDYVFLESNVTLGQAWLDAHRERMQRVFGFAPAPASVPNARARVVFR